MVRSKVKELLNERGELKSEWKIRLHGWKRNGLTDEQIAKNLGCARTTIYDWAKKYPDIANALKVGKEEANFMVENQLFRKALDGNVTAMIFYLKNNWRDKYSDSPLSPEEIKLAKERRRKAKAEADIAEFQAREITAVDNSPTSTTIINDIPVVEGEEDANDSEAKRAD